jgi:hypothetical protein
MLQKIAPTRTALAATSNNPVVHAFVGLFRAGAFLGAVGGIYMALAVFAAAALAVQWLVGY